LVVVGRAKPQQDVPYLDPAFRATQLLPDSNQTVLTGDKKTDNYVSRAHFAIRGTAGGVVVTNGVPHVGGGIRPPTNGTWLVAPVRLLDPGEEVFIASGEMIAIWLPNQCVLQLRAQ
jgi:hypothetical protein